MGLFQAFGFICLEHRCIHSSGWLSEALSSWKQRCVLVFASVVILALGFFGLFCFLLLVLVVYLFVFVLNIEAINKQ